MRVTVWDAVSGQQTLALKGHTLPVHSVVFSPDGKRIVSASDDNTLKVWDAACDQEMLTIDGAGYVNSMTFSPDGKRIASGGINRDNTVKVWDAVSGKETLTLKGHKTIVTSVAFCPDGKRIAAADQHRTVKVWDATSGQETLTLEGYAGWHRPSAPTGNGWLAAGRTLR